MKIGIDARFLGKGYGLARYLETLLGELPRLGSRHEFVVFLRREAWDMVDSAFYTRVVADVPWYSWQEQRQMPRLFRDARVDLMHIPHFNVPFTYRGPFVMTLHDLIMWHYPRPEATTLGPVMFWIKDQAHRVVVRSAVGRASAVIVPNQFTKNDVMQTMGVAGETLQVVYEAPYLAPERATSADASAILASKYQIKKPYVLYVGAAYPHKNLIGLLHAWQVCIDRYGLDHELVLIGKKDGFYREVERQVPARLRENVRFTDFVPDNDLAAFYASAALYTVPSLYEGFGLPPLEAMQYGIPVVSSDRSCLPEVLGTAALYADTTNPEHYAAALYRGLTDRNTRQELQENAREELGRYSPQRMARETLRIYEQSLGNA